MPKAISFQRGVLSVLFWSIISAAFIGPGTVTTASSAGAAFGTELLWALVFSILATIVLQESAARITIASGKNLGEIIALRYARGRGRRLKVLLFLAVFFGCAAYQAGNLLGALSGLSLFISVPAGWAPLLLGVLCGSLLWFGNFRMIANALGIVVAVMGLVFLYVAAQTDLEGGQLLNGLQPVMPAGSALLVIGLIGTTIVPYNLFLASGISQSQTVSEMRWGISLAILIGGIISVAILIVGTSVSGTFSFEALAQALASSLGSWSIAFFGLGLFAAGVSSSVTAPLAAAVTARSLFGAGESSWNFRSRNFRLVWAAVLLTGMVFGWLRVQPIPAIILAQAINGILLPVVAVFLLLAVNDRELIPGKFANSTLSNVLMLFIVGVTCFLGFNNLWKAAGRIYPPAQEWTAILPLMLAIAGGIVLLLALRIFRNRAEPERGTLS